MASGIQKEFDVPNWVAFAAHAAIGLGTLFGGWRIVKTMGSKITRLQAQGGFCAETSGALSIGLATFGGVRDLLPAHHQALAGSHGTGHRESRDGRTGPSLPGLGLTEVG